MRKILLIFSVVIICFATNVHSALIDNGDGTITDTDTNLMWLQDANYGGGIMLRDEALTWVDTLEYAGFSDWRLPSALNSDGSGPCWGFNCNKNELGHLYYEEGIQYPTYGIFINAHGRYWATYDNAYAEFDMTSGFQDAGFLSNRAWAVRDVTVVPEPISSTLFIVGGATLGIRRFRKRN